MGEARLQQKRYCTFYNLVRERESFSLEDERQVPVVLGFNWEKQWDLVDLNSQIMDRRQQNKGDDVREVRKRP
jgi:hypothetical protein